MISITSLDEDHFVVQRRSALVFQKKNFPLVLQHIRMIIPATVLVLLPVAIASAIPRGCGTAIDKDGIGQSLIADQLCQNLFFDLGRVIVADGCYCVTFHNQDCKDGNRDNWQSWVLGPTTLDMGKTKAGMDSYRCSDDPVWGEVSGE